MLKDNLKMLISVKVWWILPFSQMLIWWDGGLYVQLWKKIKIKDIFVGLASYNTGLEIL